MHEGMEADSLHPSSHLRSDVISSVWVCITHHLTFLQCWVKSCGAGTGTDYFPANIQNKNTANIYPFPLSLIPTFTLLIFIMRFPCPDFDFISMFAQSGPRTRAARVRFLQNCRARVPGCCQGEGGKCSSLAQLSVKIRPSIGQYQDPPAWPGPHIPHIHPITIFLREREQMSSYGAQYFPEVRLIPLPSSISD